MSAIAVPRQVKVLYFAWLRERVGVAEEDLDLPTTVANLADLIAWLGPAIVQAAFEVGSEVRAQFLDQDPATAGCFAGNARGRWQADLAGLARHELARRGVSAVYGGGEATYRDAQRWYSFRREPRTGRMATLLWIAHGPVPRP